MRGTSRFLEAWLLLLAVFMATPARAYWIPNGIAVSSALGTQNAPQLVSDGAGGAIVTWQDNRGGDYNIYAQRVTFSGETPWSTSGLPICAASGAQQYPRIAADGEGGAIITWFDLRNGNYDIYVQRVDSAGWPLWDSGDVPLCTASGEQSYPRIVSDGEGGALVAWQDYRAGRPEIYARRVGADGIAQGPADGVPLCTAAGDRFSPVIAPDGAGGAIVAWMDSRNGNYDVYAARLDHDGNVPWADNGIALCTAPGAQQNIAITYDGIGRAIVAWIDYRGESPDIYAQCVTAGGNVQWTSQGVAVCAAPGIQKYPTITSEGGGRALIAWTDGRNGNNDIYAQRLNASGSPQWGADGIALCSEPGEQTIPAIASNGAGGVYVAWQDYRASNYDIYAQSVDAAGFARWTTSVPLCAATGEQSWPVIISDGRGGAIAAWQDYRNSGYYYDIYAQSISEGDGLPIATLLRSFSAVFSGRAVGIAWTLSSIDDGVAFVVSRATGASAGFADLARSPIERNGLSFSFEDASIEPGATYRYRVDILTASGRANLFETEPVTTPAASLALFQNQPNPFNPSTTIRYYLPERASVRLDVYSASGARIAVLAAGVQEKGAHIASWDGRDGRGRAVASGIYFCCLRAGKEVVTRKMVLMR